MDFLLGVHDFARAGALRFQVDPDAPFLDDSKELAAPPVTSLRELARISQKLEQPGADDSPEIERWLMSLIAPGSSLGGARPKASFTDDDGSLWIAKFPGREDRHDVGGWEFVLHELAKTARIDVPPARLEHLTRKHGTFCVGRFDRSGPARRLFVSAMTLLDHRDGERDASYLELAEIIASQGASRHIATDLAQLFRRVIFNVLVSNRDDHLRNHGFLRSTSGWRLAPAFDVNPNLDKREHALRLDESSTEPDLEAVLATAEFYRLTRRQSENVLRETRRAVGQWQSVALASGLSRAECQRMAPAFDLSS